MAKILPSERTPAEFVSHSRRQRSRGNASSFARPPVAAGKAHGDFRVSSEALLRVRSAQPPSRKAQEPPGWGKWSDALAWEGVRGSPRPSGNRPGLPWRRERRVQMSFGSPLFNADPTAHSGACFRILLEDARGRPWGGPGRFPCLMKGVVGSELPTFK